MSRRSGFTLIEMMVASAVSLGVLAGGLVVMAQLQRRAVLEGRTAATQGALTQLQDVIGAELERAGSGSGSARLSFGGVEKYAIDVKSNEAFASDATFALPPAAYTSGGANLTSDFLEVWASDTGRALSTVRCPSSKLRDGAWICTTAAWPASMVGKNVFAVNPTMRRACAFEVTAVVGGPSTHAVRVGDPHGATAIPAGTLCAADFAASPDAKVSEFWDSDELMLVPASSRAFRVNWKTGGPVLEIDPDGTAEPLGWQVLSRHVEQLKVRFALANRAIPSAALAWYPDPATSTRALDLCPADATATPPPGCAVPGAAGFDPTLDETTVRDALMHRVRNVEVAFTARAGVADSEQVSKSGSTFLLDDESNRRDGFKRRSFAITVTPRNYASSRN